MVLRLADMKKSVRARSDGERYVHPKLLEGESACAQIALALAYFDGRLGRPRRDLDPEVVLRCFGDPVLARGVVACLSATYRWRSLTFADVLDQKTIGRLAALGIHT